MRRSMKRIQHGYVGLLRVIDPVTRVLRPPRRKGPSLQPGAPPGLEPGFVDVETFPEQGAVRGVVHDYGPDQIEVSGFDGSDAQLPAAKPERFVVASPSATPHSHLAKPRSRMLPSES